MATKKSASGAKKSSAKAGTSKSTRITTVKAVEAGGSRRSMFAAASPWVNRSNSFLRMPVMSASLAEFIGTFLLAITILIVRNEPFYLFIGLVGIFMLVGGLSGAHVNPAVTIGAWVTRRINWVRAVSYIAAQVLAAMLALVVMNAFFAQAPEVSPEAAAFGQSAPQLFKANVPQAGKEWPVFFAEMIGLVVLGFGYASVLRTNIKDKVTGAFTVGGAGFLAMAFASTTAAYVSSTTALNPAVAITLKALDFQNIWTLVVYVVAPLLGAIVGFFLYDLIRTTEE
jgi:glycerol uptake facilitator-like aquaporin